MKIIISFFSLTLLWVATSSFCGFYVAQAGSKLYNKSSEVILTRDGDRTVITMANDFQGDVKDFAMVVPVPVVLRRDQIKVVESDIFKRLDGYSGPRLVEYHDENPCEPRVVMDMVAEMAPVAMRSRAFDEKMTAKSGVTIEAQYSVGEYDILILSAQESGGLERWLTANGYKIPPGAQEVLTPYIRSNMKFFVVKVNLERQTASEYKALRPLQIRFDSPKFMLPIRLGMANARDFQDLTIYAFTKKGRVETTNYRTVNIPTDLNIPEFVKGQFGEFYKSMFERAWSAQKNAVFAEYAWDLSSSNFVKCDPCATTPPEYAQLSDAGVDWVTADDDNRQQGGSGYSGDVFFTRLHVRYDRQHFPQDLQFQETRNRENFQGRYIMTHAAEGNLNCDGAKTYLVRVYERRQEELETLAALTGWNVEQHKPYAEEYRSKAEKAGAKFDQAPVKRGELTGSAQPKSPIGHPLAAAALVLAVVLGVFYLVERKGRTSDTK
jgi:hypothetical protein